MKGYWKGIPVTVFRILGSLLRTAGRGRGIGAAEKAGFRDRDHEDQLVSTSVTQRD